MGPEQFEQQLLRLAQAQNWLTPQQADYLRNQADQARINGHSFTLEQWLLQPGALNAAQLQSLVQQLKGSGAHQILDQESLTRTVPLGSAPPRQPTQFQGSDSAPGFGQTRLDSDTRSPGSRDGDHFKSVVSGDAELAQRYDVIEEIARGGMGAILRARDKVLKREVAMKVLLKRARSRGEMRFLEEAQITGQLDHPNIVPVHDLGQRDGNRYFTMKLVRGRSLAEQIAQQENGELEISLNRNLAIFLKILEAVSFAHSRGVLHRDLKPENVMIGSFGEVLVMDWGLAKLMDNAESDSPLSRVEIIESLRQDSEGQWTIDGAVCGTPNYMSPEQAEGRLSELDARADVYALGCILYEMLTLRQAFAGETMQELMSRVFSNNYIDPIQAAKPRFLPQELAAVIGKALSANKSERYSSVAELQNDIEAFLDGRAVSARADPIITRISKWYRRNALVASVVTISVIAAVTIIGFLFLMPATLILNKEFSGKDYKVYIDNKRQTLSAEGTLSIWPPREFRLRVTRDSYRDFLTNVNLASRERRELPVKLSRQTGGLTVSSTQGEMELELTNDQGKTLKLRAPVFDRQIPTGKYQYKIKAPNYFSQTGDIEIKTTQATKIDAQLEPAIIWDAKLQSEVLDRIVADVNKDGKLDLVIATYDFIGVFDLDQLKTRWRIELPRNRKRRHVVGRHVEIADFDGDSDIEIAYQDGREFHFVNAETGTEEGTCTEFFGRLTAANIDERIGDELIVSTPYSGTSAYRISGERIWSRFTGRYSDGSAPKIYLDKNGIVSNIIIQRRSPNYLISMDPRTRVFNWNRPTAPTLGPRNTRIHYGADKDRLFISDKGQILALNLKTGKRDWGSQLKPRQRTMQILTGPLGPGNTDSLIVLGIDSLWCMTPQGKLKWTTNCGLLGSCCLGDVDGDGNNELVIVGHSSESSAIAQVRIMDENGKIQSSFELLLPNVDSEVSILNPTIVDSFGDGIPSLLIVLDDRVILSKLAPLNQKLNTTDASYFMVAEDLDADGKPEILRVNRSSIVCDGSTKWTADTSVDPGVSKRRQISDRYGVSSFPIFGDFDGDGVKDVFVRRQNWMFGFSGKTGKCVLRRYFRSIYQSTNYFQSQDTGSILVVATSDRLMAIRYRKGDPLGETAWDVKWGKAEGQIIAVRTPQPTLISAEGARILTWRDATTGEAQKQVRLREPVGLGGPIVVGDKIFVPGSVGNLSVYSLTGEYQGQQKVLSSATYVRAPDGDLSQSVLIWGFEQQAAIVDVKTLKVIRNVNIPDFSASGSWSVDCHDVNGDGRNDYLISNPVGNLVIIDSESGQRLFQSSRLKPYSSDLGERPSRMFIVDVDNDRRLDLLLSQKRSSVLCDLDQHLKRYARFQKASTPEIELAYLTRELIANREDTIAVRLRNLQRTRLRFRAESRVAQYNVRYKKAEGSADAVDYVNTLLLKLRAGEALSQNLETTYRKLSHGVTGVLRTLPELRITESERQQIVLHIQQAFRGNKMVRDRLVDNAQLYVADIDPRHYVNALARVVQVFPDDIELRRRFETAAISAAVVYHNAFERATPLEIMNDALKVCPSSRLALTTARIMEVRQRTELKKILDYYQQAINLASTDEQKALAYIFRSYLLFRLNDPKYAKFVQQGVDQARKHDRNNKVITGLLGLMFLRQKQPQRAFQYLSSACEGDLDDPFNIQATFLQNRARLHLSKGQVFEAEADYHRALKISGSHESNLSFQWELGFAFIRKGKPEKGLQILEQTAFCVTGERSIRYRREARLIKKQIDYQNAIRRKTRTARFAQLALQMFQKRADQIDPIREKLKQFIQVAPSPDNVDYLFDIVEIEFDSGRPTQALKWLDRFKSEVEVIAPARYYLQYVIAYDRMKDKARAEEWAAKALNAGLSRTDLLRNRLQGIANSDRIMKLEQELDAKQAKN